MNIVLMYLPIGIAFNVMNGSVYFFQGKKLIKKH